MERSSRSTLDRVVSLGLRPTKLRVALLAILAICLFVYMTDPLREANAAMAREKDYTKSAMPALSSEKTANLDDAHRDVQTALKNMLDLSPGEDTVKSLLKPIDTVNQTRIWDVGFRTREFKKYLSAWEALHVVYDRAAARADMRTDIQRYLRKAPLSHAINSQRSRVDIVGEYDRYRAFLSDFSHVLFPFVSGFFPDVSTLRAQLYSGGRGIVMIAGNDQATFALGSIASLRRQGCNLPVEVHYIGEADLEKSWRVKLESIPGVVTRDLKKLVHVPEGGWSLKGWAAKPFALLLSSFREVLFLDADVLFFRDPTGLFDEDKYKESGALFFYDRIIYPRNQHELLDKILPKPITQTVLDGRWWTGESGEYQESGVMVVDSWRHFVSMLLVSRLNGPDRDGYPDNGKGVYDYMWGDKDTYWLGFELASDTHYRFDQGEAAIMGKLKELHQPEPPTNADDAEKHFTVVDATNMTVAEIRAAVDAHPESEFGMCSPQLLHLDAAGRPWWFNGWIQANKKERDSPIEPFDFFMGEMRVRPEKRTTTTAEGKAGAAAAAEKREHGDWAIGDNNRCCLRTDNLHTFNREERATLDMFTEVAREIGVAV